MSSRQTTPDILGDVLAAAPEPAQARPTKLSLHDINRSGGTQPRAALDERYIADLVEVLKNSGSLPPVDVTYDGAQYWLHDGFHRWEAHRLTGLNMIDAIVHQGDLQAAQWQSYAANQAHGLRRTREDRERAIRAALKHPAGQQLSNREIAKHLGVDDKTIGKYREEMEQAAQIPQVRERTGGDGKTYTANSRSDTPRNDLTVEETQAFLHRYFHASTLARFAQASDPREAARRHMVQSGSGYWGDDWRYDSRSGKVAVWDIAHHGAPVISRDPLRHREPDAIFTYERLAKMAMDLLPVTPEPVPAPEPEPRSSNLATVAEIEVYVRQLTCSTRALREAYQFDSQYYLTVVNGLRRDGRRWESGEMQLAFLNVANERDAAAIAEQRAAPAPEPESEMVSLADLPVVASVGPVPMSGLVDQTVLLRAELRQAGYSLWARYENGQIVAAGASESATAVGQNTMGGADDSTDRAIDWCEESYARKHPAIVAAPDSPPLPAWVGDEPEQEPDAAPGQIADLAMRVLNLKLWRASFTMALKNMDLWAEATGHFSATLEAERGLRHLIELSDNELAALAA
jgi:hypothetical protein